MKLRIAPSTLSCDACSPLPTGSRCPARCARNFVLGGWSASMKHSREAGIITAADWDDVMHVQIAKICAREECRVLIAYGKPSHAERLEGLAEGFQGFIAGEPNERVVYYCFVKELYRRQGVARALFAALDIDPKSRFVYPCNTRMLNAPETNLRLKIPLAIRDPAVARYPKSERHRSYAA